LAQALQQQTFDLLLVSPYSLSGRKDGPGRLAEYLHLPLLPHATEIQWRTGVLNGLCRDEDEALRMECPTPAIASVASNLSPRLPKLSAIVRAKKMPISSITAAERTQFDELCLAQHSVEGTRRRLIFDQEANALELFMDALKAEIGLARGMDSQ
jgi:electron transfer flavoprotein alpha/beta subunit